MDRCGTYKLTVHFITLLFHCLEYFYLDAYVLFHRYAIDTMQSVCLKEAGLNAAGTSAGETTLIQLIFGGYLRSKVLSIIT